MTSSLFSLNTDHGFPNFGWHHLISLLGQSSPWCQCPFFFLNPTVVCPLFLTAAGPNDVKSQLGYSEHNEPKKKKNRIGTFSNSFILSI